MFKKLSVIALFLLIIGGIGCLATYSQVTGGKTITQEKSIVDPFTKVTIFTENGRVKILPSDSPNARIEIVKKGADAAKLKFKAETEGKTLKITAEDKRTFRFGFISHKADIILYLPEKEYDSIAVETDNGSITLENLKARTIEGRTDNGRIKLKRIAAKEVNTVTSNGKLKFDHVEGKLKGKTDNGEISLITNDLERDIHFETDNGKISIKTDKEPVNAALNASTDNGKINILDKYTGSAVFGSGQNSIYLKTDNGKITVTH